MNTKTNPAVAEYLARTQAALADLPASEIEEILEDIGPHLSEIADELGEDISVGALSERLGTPEQYASELRAAAGYPPAESASPPRHGRTAAPRFALWALVYGVVLAFLIGVSGMAVAAGGGVVGVFVVFGLPLLVAIALVFTRRVRLSEVADLREYHAARRWVDGLPDGLVGYVRSLRPAWWLVRIVLLAGVVLLVLTVGGRSAELVLLSLAALVVLLLFGAKARNDARWRWIVAPANAFAAGLILALIATGWVVAISGGRQADNSGAPYPTGSYTDNRYVSNIYPFGPDGTPLTEVYLYDQDGRPVNVPRAWCDSTYSYEPTNKVPQPRLEFDYQDQGRCREVHGVPFTVAIPTSIPQPTTTTAPPTTTTGK